MNQNEIEKPKSYLGKTNPYILENKIKKHVLEGKFSLALNGSSTPPHIHMKYQFCPYLKF